MLGNPFYLQTKQAIVTSDECGVCVYMNDCIML